MKKMMKALVAVPVLVGLAAVPAIAEERLSLSGEMRVRGWVVDQETNDVDDAFADQRLRIMGKIKAAENVNVVFRTDVTEANWGQYDGFGSGRLVHDNSSMQWDRAYIDLTQGIFNLQAGLVYAAFSPTSAVNVQDNGIVVNVKGAVPVKAFVILDDDGSAAATETTPAVAATDADDAWMYGVSVAPSFGENVKTEFFAAGYNGGDTFVDRDVYAFGAFASAGLGMATILGEVNFFTGDHNDTTDATGIQGWLAANLAVTDTITIQPALWYAQAADDNEQQYVVLGNGATGDFDGFDPVWDVGTKLDNEKIALGRPFDWTGAGAGVMGATLKAFAKLSDALNVGASLGYLTVEDDDIVDADAIAVAAGATYEVMANTSLQAQVQWLSAEIEGEDADNFQAGLGLFVTF
ncbi:hypothetical protein [Desulfofustis limnaeus]|jgi:hypothetical protein|uniref:Porin domain-containing protein n=1 Tax=Desulfofustis limnaeus TaxID=2740163 RepID=A0ABM7W4N1_9BACT|nr:hypothetical protein [Desulfofustis limnaeus]MDX9894079.1 hypothetical protein [Desulfofustis sp.]BDD85866.1 hypothetical protein DPPLL_02310 [Desulfofustis limnaeus]